MVNEGVIVDGKHRGGAAAWLPGRSIVRAGMGWLAATRRGGAPKEGARALLPLIEQEAHVFGLAISADLRVTFATSGGAAALGLEADGLPLSTRPGWEAFVALAQKQPETIACEVTTPGGDEAHFFSIRAVAIRDGAGRFSGYHLLCRRKVADATIEAEDPSLHAATAQYLALMSHELRTPLNAIQGFTDLLLSPHAGDMPADIRNHHLKTIADAGQQLAWLINDMLDLTRIEHGGLTLAEQEADAAELTEVAVKMCRQAADHGDITIVARVIEGVEVRGDIVRLKQILVTLITLAVNLSTTGGFVYAGFERGRDGGLAFTVRDSGLGVAPEMLAALFEPFAPQEGGASRRIGGVGLAIARKLARLHGGDVTLDSDIGAGTTARLHLPASRVSWALGGHASVA